jgi:hypothetical protein
MPDAIEFAHVTISSKICRTVAARQAATPMFLTVVFAVYAVSSRLVMGSRSLNRERLLGFGGAV